MGSLAAPHNNNDPGALRWLLPSWTHVLWLTLLLATLSPAHRTLMVATDGDVCMHWRTGAEMLQSGHILRSNVFSHTLADQPFVTKEWLAEVALAWAGQLAGLFGLCVVASVVIATTYALLNNQLLREGNDLLASVAIALLAALAGSIHWLARPHIFTLLLTLLWNDALRRYEHGGSIWRLAWVLPVLMVFWVNLHGAFLVGFIILAAYAAGAAIEWLAAKDRTSREQAQRKIAAYAGAGLLSVLASLANPNGWQLYVHNLRFLQSAFLTDLLLEHRSIDFQSPDAIGCLLWIGLLFGTLIFLRPRVTAAEGVLILLWTALALRSVRHMPLMALVTAPILAAPLSRAVGGRLRAFSERMQRLNNASRGWAVAAALAIAWIAALPHPTVMPSNAWPNQAADFIRGHSGQFAGNMFNQYSWGGYLMKFMPEHKVFINGFADFFGERFVREYYNACMLGSGWQKTLDKHNVAWTIFPTGDSFNEGMALLPDWQRVYRDDTTTIFCKKVRHE